MASTFVADGEEYGEQQQVLSPRNIRRSLSSNSSCGHHEGGASSPPKCVCAPATHARSFKCRLHRVNSQGHSSPPPSAAPLSGKQPAVSSAPTPTVEAQ